MDDPANCDPDPFSRSSGKAADRHCDVREAGSAPAGADRHVDVVLKGPDGNDLLGPPGVRRPWRAPRIDLRHDCAVRQ